ncbi:hypothetical protein EQ500_04675, partial [Lactobacillus sp. XV13L]|nr:hypothetical protein [Lactobacillus sp. XV13L]
MMLKLAKKLTLLLGVLLIIPLTMGFSLPTKTVPKVQTISIYNSQGQKVAQTHSRLACKRIYHLTNNSFNNKEVHLNAQIPANSKLQYRYLLTTANHHPNMERALYSNHNNHYLKTKDYPISIFPVHQSYWRL